MSLADQIEELEQDAAMYRSRCSELDDDLDRANSEIDDLQHALDELTEQLAWIHELHPELEAAYAAKQRLDEAT